MLQNVDLSNICSHAHAHSDQILQDHHYDDSHRRKEKRIKDVTQSYRFPPKSSNRLVLRTTTTTTDFEFSFISFSSKKENGGFYGTCRP